MSTYSEQLRKAEATLYRTLDEHPDLAPEVAERSNRLESFQLIDNVLHFTLERHPHIFGGHSGYPLKAGHPLEGSCQEGKHPPYTPFCIFCRGMSHGISLPICRFARTRVFSGCDVTRPMATHQTPIRIKAHDGHLALWPGIRPLAHLVPQKTLGTLPCPIVTSTVHVALP